MYTEPIINLNRLGKSQQKEIRDIYKKALEDSECGLDYSEVAGVAAIKVLHKIFGVSIVD